MIRAGIDIGGTNIKAGLVEDQTGAILAQSAVGFPSGRNESAVWDTLYHLMDRLLDSCGMDFSQVPSLGVAVPGSIDSSGERVLHAYNLDFSGTPIKEALTQKFPGVPILILNDANAATLAEHSFGALRGIDTGVLITLGTGVGGGLILGGKLFNGGNGNGVEIGHMTLNYDGKAHHCGNRGCVETYCCAGALTEHGSSWKNAEEVFRAFQSKDPIALASLDAYVEALSSAIVSITNMLDPQVIALGGGISNAGAILIDPIIDRVAEKSFFKKRYSIVQAALGGSAGFVGAAVAHSHVLQNT